jgi:ABC-type phosphate transport system substrate-binding protein
MSHRRVLLLALLFFVTILPGRAAGAQEAFRVVTHTATPAASIARADLAKIYLRKSRSWPGGGAATPVDLKESLAARRAFSQQVLGRDVDAAKAYWQQLIFTGKGVPPLEKGSDAEVLAYVAATPGAVGYVSPGAALPGGVKALKVDP